MYASITQFLEARAQAQVLGTITIWALSQRGWVKHGRRIGFFPNGVYQGLLYATSTAATASALTPSLHFYDVPPQYVIVLFHR